MEILTAFYLIFNIILLQYNLFSMLTAPLRCTELILLLVIKTDIATGTYRDYVDDTLDHQDLDI